MNDPFVTLAEFQAISGLSDGAVVWLLRSNALPLRYSTAEGLRVDASAASARSLIEAIMRDHGAALEQHEAVLAEKAAAVVARHLELIIDEAIERVSRTDGRTEPAA